MIKTNENYEMLWDFAEESVSLSSALMFGKEDDAEHYALIEVGCNCFGS